VSNANRKSSISRSKHSKNSDRSSSFEDDEDRSSSYKKANESINSDASVLVSVKSQPDDRTKEKGHYTSRKNYQYNEVDFGQIEVHLDNVQKPEWSTDSVGN
jgi:hypothetical protein